jgi:uncharacterized membrane protein YtjA (UPF0391 family)
MLKRAQFWMKAAAVAGAFGFTGVLEATAPLTQTVFYFCAAMAVLSLLFWLFEDAEEIPHPQENSLPVKHPAVQVLPPQERPAPVAAHS